MNLDFPDNRHPVTLLALVSIRIRGFCHSFAASTRDPLPRRWPAAIMTRNPFVLRGPKDAFAQTPAGVRDTSTANVPVIPAPTAAAATPTVESSQGSP